MLLLVFVETDLVAKVFVASVAGEILVIQVDQPDVAHEMEAAVGLMRAQVAAELRQLRVQVHLG